MEERTRSSSDLSGGGIGSHASTSSIGVGGSSTTATTGPIAKTMPPNQLLGICLVVSGDRGSQVVFRDPVSETTKKEHRWQLNALFSTALTTVLEDETASFHDSIGRPKSHMYGLAAVEAHKERSQVMQRVELVHGIPAKQFARLFSVNIALHGQTVELVIGNKKFVGYPINLPTSSSHEITYFHCVFVLDARQDSTLFKSINIKFAKALAFEQKRCGYLTQQVQLMFHIRDEFTRNRGSCDPRGMMDSILNVSQLANHIRSLRNSLNRKGEALLSINQWLHLHVTLREGSPSHMAPIRPYQSILLLDTPQKLLADLPPDASPLLRRFVRKMEPRHSFEEMASDLDVPLNALYQLASHLVYWRKARITDALQKQNTYVVSPRALEHLARMTALFSREFPRSSYNLQELLSRFSVQKTLAEHIENQQNRASIELIQLLLWTLKHDLIVPLHRYIYFLGAPTDEELALDEHKNHEATAVAAVTASKTGKRTMKRSVLIKKRLSAREEDFITAASQEGAEQNLLGRLLPLFRGKFHAQEIIWRENLTLADIDGIITKYPDDFVQIWHE